MGDDASFRDVSFQETSWIQDILSKNALISGNLVLYKKIGSTLSKDISGNLTSVTCIPDHFDFEKKNPFWEIGPCIFKKLIKFRTSGLVCLIALYICIYLLIKQIKNYHSLICAISISCGQMDHMILLLSTDKLALLCLQ